MIGRAPCAVPDGSRALNPYVAQFSYLFIQMLIWAVVARALISFLPIDQSGSAYQLLYRITEPIMDPVRRFMPNTGMLDMSPLVVIIGLIIVAQMVLGLAA